MRYELPHQETQLSTPHRTRLQRQLLAKPLHAGNLKAYIDSISLVDFEAVLSRYNLQNQEDRSIFSYLVDPGDGISLYDAASAVLEELAGKTENVAILATLAYRLRSQGLMERSP